MNDFIENLWLQLEVLFQSFASRLLLGCSEAIHNIGRFENENFLFTAYLSFLKEKDSGEVSIAVDIKYQDDIYYFESDIVGEDGQIIAEGPSLEIRSGLSDDLLKDKLDDWLSKFEEFLINNEGGIREAVGALE